MMEMLISIRYAICCILSLEFEFFVLQSRNVTFEKAATEKVTCADPTGLYKILKGVAGKDILKEAQALITTGAYDEHSGLEVQACLTAATSHADAYPKEATEADQCNAWKFVESNISRLTASSDKA